MIIRSKLKENFKQYESLSISLEKVLSFIQDLQGGIIQLAWIINPNTIYEPENLIVFVDNLFCYG